MFLYIDDDWTACSKISWKYGHNCKRNGTLESVDRLVKTIVKTIVQIMW